MKTMNDLKKIVESGATIIDVRTPAEFQMGHPKNAINIPLQEIDKKISEIQKMKQPIVVCCASGMRSATAQMFLQSHGIETYNAGPWQTVNF